MLELLKVSVVGMSILFGIAFVGNDCTLPDLSYEEEVVEEVDHSMDGYYELKALQDELDDLNEIDNGIEVEEYLIANNIQYTSKDVNEDMDRYINITKGNWELEVLYHKADGSCCWILLESALVE